MNAIAKINCFALPLLTLLIAVTNSHGQTDLNDSSDQSLTQRISTFVTGHQKTPIRQASFLKRIGVLCGKQCSGESCQKEVVFEVAEIRYGGNLGFPQFGQITHGVWYNGPKFGPKQNSRACGGSNSQGQVFGWGEHGLTGNEFQIAETGDEVGDVPQFWTGEVARQPIGIGLNSSDVSAAAPPIPQK